MVRPIAFLAGLGFVGILLYSLLMGATAYITEPPAKTAEKVFHLHPKEITFASDGPLGKFDRQQLQRGFQVYKEVCAACHSLHQVAFRDLTDLGFTAPEVKAIAKGWATEVPSINPETGEPATRKGTPADKIPTPYANETAARAANNNALPPDLSLVSKSRHGGAAYIYSILTGFQKEQPAALLKQFPDAKTPPSLHYNPYFANLNIAMPPPLVADGQVTYSDGTKASVDQMAEDVSAFLVWTAEPKLEARHRTGVAVVIFLLMATGLAYLSYRNIWAGIKH
jgi:ubiquinol-cytochrome c reductase cytochrome c1 subunit